MSLDSGFGVVIEDGVIAIIVNNTNFPSDTPVMRFRLLLRISLKAISAAASAINQ